MQAPFLFRKCLAKQHFSDSANSNGGVPVTMVRPTLGTRALTLPNTLFYTLTARRLPPI
jgi:hypothetical protein